MEDDYLNLSLLDSNGSELFDDDSSFDSDENNEGTKEKLNDNHTEDDDGFDNEPIDNPESVSEEDNNPLERQSDNEIGTSPNSYSSIAKAFVLDGVFSRDVITEEDIKNCTTPEAFEELLRKYVLSLLSEQLKRVTNALDSGVAPDEIRYYETMLNELDSITEEGLKEEGERGENLRKSIIIQEYLNRGYSQERAQSIAEDSLKKGLDIEDAIKYLQTNKDFFKGAYDKILKERAIDKKNQQESLKKAVYEPKTFFGDLEVDETTKNKVWDSIMSPIKTEDGRVINKIQKYADEHPMEFRANLGLMYVLTNGFTDLSGLVGKKVKKLTASALRDIESKLNNSPRGGGLHLVENGNDPESHIGTMRLDFGNM